MRGTGILSPFKKRGIFKIGFDTKNNSFMDLHCPSFSKTETDEKA
jgi:hypothetical protein